MKKLFIFIFLIISSTIYARDTRPPVIEDNGPTSAAHRYTPCPAARKQIILDWSPSLVSSLGLISYYFLYKVSLKDIYATTRSTIYNSPYLLRLSVGLGVGAWIYDYYKPRIVRLKRYLYGK